MRNKEREVPEVCAKAGFGDQLSVLDQWLQAKNEILERPRIWGASPTCRGGDGVVLTDVRCLPWKEQGRDVLVLDSLVDWPPG